MLTCYKILHEQNRLISDYQNILIQEKLISKLNLNDNRTYHLCITFAQECFNLAKKRDFEGSIKSLVLFNIFFDNMKENLFIYDLIKVHAYPLISYYYYAVGQQEQAIKLIKVIIQKSKQFKKIDVIYFFFPNPTNFKPGKDGICN